MNTPRLSKPVTGKASEAESRQITELEDYFDDAISVEVAAEQTTHTTTVRWTVRQLRAIERAAAIVGMPYQTYVKDAAFRRALQDLVDARHAGVYDVRHGCHTAAVIATPANPVVRSDLPAHGDGWSHNRRISSQRTSSTSNGPSSITAPSCSTRTRSARSSAACR